MAAVIPSSNIIMMYCLLRDRCRASSVIGTNCPAFGEERASFLVYNIVDALLIRTLLQNLHLN